MNPQNTVFDAKRLIEQRFSDPSVQAEMKNWSFKVVAGAGDKPMIVVQYKGAGDKKASRSGEKNVLIFTAAPSTFQSSQSKKESSKSKQPPATPTSDHEDGDGSPDAAEEGDEWDFDL